MLKKILIFIIKAVLWFLLIIFLWLYVLWLLCGCGTPNNLGGSYTRLYPITSYEIEDERITATYIIEDGSEGEINTPATRIHIHDGEDTLIVISSEKDGTDFDGVKDHYLYLNSENMKEYIGTMIDSMVENGG